MTDRSSDSQSPDRDRLRHKDAHSNSDMGTDTHTWTHGDSGTDTHKTKGDSHKDIGQRHGEMRARHSNRDTDMGPRLTGRDTALDRLRPALAGIPYPELCPSAGFPGKLSHYGPAGGWTHSHVPAWPALSRSEPCVSTVRPACPACLLCSKPSAATSPSTPTIHGHCYQRHLVQTRAFSIRGVKLHQSGRDRVQTQANVSL